MKSISLSGQCFGWAVPSPRGRPALRPSDCTFLRLAETEKALTPWKCKWINQAYKNRKLHLDLVGKV